MRKQIIDNAVSNKITFLSLIFSISIVCVHMNPIWDFQNITNDGGFFDVSFNYLNDLLTSLGSLAVSFFFLSSAFLLYRNYKIGQFPEKLKRRIMTLFVPLVLWNVLCMIYQLRFSDGFLETIKNILLSNYDGPLWFVVQILGLFLLSPMILWMFRNKYIGGVLSGLFFFLPLVFDTYLVRLLTDNEQQIAVISRSVYYLPIYFTGAYMAIHFDAIIQSERYRKPIPMILSALLLLVTLLPYNQVIIQFLMQFQVLAWWIILSKKNFINSLSWKYQISFFLYASHAIVVGVVMRFLHKFILDETIPVSIGMALLGRLLFLALCVSCIYLAAWILIRWLPKIYSLLSGGRLPEKQL